jgi:hypothetical protein
MSQTPAPAPRANEDLDFLEMYEESTAIGIWERLKPRINDYLDAHDARLMENLKKELPGMIRREDLHQLAKFLRDEGRALLEEIVDERLQRLRGGNRERPR